MEIIKLNANFVMYLFVGLTIEWKHTYWRWQEKRVRQCQKVTNEKLIKLKKIDNELHWRWKSRNQNLSL